MTVVLKSIELAELPVPIEQGEGALLQLGRIAKGNGGSRALIVTDSGIVAAGHVAQAIISLEAAGLAVDVFSEVHENPTTEDVDRCAQRARAHQADVLIGLGGGSSMDAAKGCNFILTNGGRMQDYWGLDKATRPMLPFIAVPTTAGTGSECQRFALISDPGSHQKMACGDPKAAARAVILDPLLTTTQPEFVTACTGMDAVAHAVETAVTKPANDKSLHYSYEAFRLLLPNLPRVMRKPGDLEARTAMQIGAALAGAAIENSMLGATHSAANPLTAHLEVVHGQAVGNLLPHVVRFNAEDDAVAHGYRDLAVSGDLVGREASPREAVAALTGVLEQLLTSTKLLCPLSRFGLEEDQLERFAGEATSQWTAQFNPRAVSKQDFVAMYRQAL